MATSIKKKIFYYFFFFLLILFGGLGAVAVYAYQKIPSVDNINGCFKTSMFQVDLCPKKYTYVRYSQLPKHLVASLIASEDASFYFHKGFDWEEIKDSLEKSMDAGRWVRGGSTITQQLAKNLYLSKEKSLSRKMKEFFIAKEIEKKLSKTQIIEKYFNVVEFAKNTYGIYAASQYYFQKPPADLTPAEGAYLISLLPNPIKYSSAFRSNKELSRYNKNRVSRILSLLKLQGKISEGDYINEQAKVDYGLWSGPPPSSLDSVDTTYSDGFDENSDLETVPETSRPPNDNEAPELEGDF
jgi:monofunctional glycosyltransferase